MKKYIARKTRLKAPLIKKDKASFSAAANAVRDKLAAAGVADQDVQNAVEWARHKDDRAPKHD